MRKKLSILVLSILILMLLQAVSVNAKKPSSSLRGTMALTFDLSAVWPDDPVWVGTVDIEGYGVYDMHIDLNGRTAVPEFKCCYNGGCHGRIKQQAGNTAVHGGEWVVMIFSGLQLKYRAAPIHLNDLIAYESGNGRRHDVTIPDCL